jgi:hypothetical protein
MTAATLSLFVLVPAMTGSAGSTTTQMANAAPPVAKEAIIMLDRVEVRGVREATVASATATPREPKQRIGPVGAVLQNIYPVSAAASMSIASEEQRPSSEKRAPRKQ